MSVRTRRLKSPLSFVAFLAICGLGAPLVLIGCASPAQAEIAPAAKVWRDGDGTPIVKDKSYDPRLSLAPLLDKVRPAVVSVRVRGRADPRRAPFSFPIPTPAPGHDGRPSGVGSGFILSANGLVVTNHHVVARSDTFEVELGDGRLFSGKLLGSDPATDLAVLQLEGAKNLPTVVLGESDALRVGDWVVAIGTPIGLEQSATTGILSAKGRGSLGLYADSYIDFLQIDASLAPGNSGGPLFNLNGEVVGINTAVASFVPGRGPGFAIPIDQAKRVIPQLKNNGKVVRGWLGIKARLVEPAVGRTPPPGAVVGEVYPNTPAGRGGLRTGDRITEVGKHSVKDFEDLRSRIADLPPGKKVTVQVERDGKNKALTVTLARRPGAEKMRSLQTGRNPTPPANPGGSSGLYGRGEPRLGI